LPWQNPKGANVQDPATRLIYRPRWRPYHRSTRPINRSIRRGSQPAEKPKWVDQDRYYVEAKAAVPAGGHDLMLMLQTLLADRFKLALHYEQRAIPGYRLVVGRVG
jgi:uncharacterized protein DUF3738